MPDINQRLESFYAEHPEARPTVDGLRLLYDGSTLAWYVVTAGYPQDGGSAAPVVRGQCLDPDALHRDALAGWLSRNTDGVRIEMEAEGDVCHVITWESGSEREYEGDCVIRIGRLEALLAAAEAVGGEG